MKKQLGFLIVILTCAWQVALYSADTNISPDEALKRLKAGNERFINNEMKSAERHEERRAATETTQSPFAVILGCSDSRVLPEYTFDQGVGDLFVVRVAGNVIDPVVLDSIEFSVKVFGSVLVVVLGHENCGAVRATLEGNTKDIEAVAELIQPSVDKIRGTPGNTLENAVKANVFHMLEQLKNSPVITTAIKNGKLKVVGGYYNLRSGRVDWLDEPQKK